MKAAGLASLILFGFAALHGAAQEPTTSIVRKDGQNVWAATSKSYDVRIEASTKPSLTIRKKSKGEIETIAKLPLLSALALEANDAYRDRKASLIEGQIEKMQRGDALILRYAVSSDIKETLTFHFFDQYFTYQSLWEGVETKGKPFSISYFSQSPNESAGDTSFFVENDEVSTWTPDLYNALIPEQGRSKVVLAAHSSSASDSYLRGFSAGSPLVPPYVASLRAGTEWWGIGTIAIPATSDGLDLTIERKNLGVSFGSSQAGSGQSKIAGPVIGIFLDDQPGSILNEYLSAAKAEKEDADLERRKEWHSWWADPIYCTWGEEAYAARIKEGTLQEEHGGRYITDANLSKWIHLAKQKQLPVGTVIIDLGWMVGYGDFEPNPTHFVDLRKTIDQLHAQGLHVLLWVPMYEATGNLFSPDKTVSEVAKKHQNWIVKNRSGQSADVFDFTNPEVRAYVKQRIHLLLSSDANSLNADGLKLDFMDRVPDPAQSSFFDPAWGVGEAMQARVLELYYSSAKEAKSDSLIDSSFMNPLFGNWQDIVRLNDDVSNSIDTYWWRAWSASLNDVPAIDGDDWWAMESYFVPLTLAKAAWGIPNLYAIEYRGEQGTYGPVGGISSIASGGYPVGIRNEDYRRVRAILDVYKHAPASSKQKVHVDPSKRQAWRTYSEGPMAGQLAATTLNHGFALATYDDSSIWITCVSDDELLVPVPKARHVSNVYRVSIDGKRQETPFHIEADGHVRIQMQDSANGAEYYAVEYEASKHSK